MEQQGHAAGQPTCEGQSARSRPPCPVSSLPAGRGPKGRYVGRPTRVRAPGRRPPPAFGAKTLVKAWDGPGPHHWRPVSLQRAVVGSKVACATWGLSDGPLGHRHHSSAGRATGRISVASDRAPGLPRLRFLRPPPAARQAPPSLDHLPRAGPQGVRVLRAGRSVGVGRSLGERHARPARRPGGPSDGVVLHPWADLLSAADPSSGGVPDRGQRFEGRARRVASPDPWPLGGAASVQAPAAVQRRSSYAPTLKGSPRGPGTPVVT